MTAKSLSVGAAGLFFLLLVLLMPGATAGEPWWDDRWTYRVAITVDAAGYTRADKPAEAPINFTALLGGLGAAGRFDPDSIRVVEVAGTAVVDSSVPFQFERAADYHPVRNAAGTLVIFMKGHTAADAARTYHVYFDTAGGDFLPPLFLNLVRLNTITDPYGYETYRFTTPGGTYHYHIAGGGFASLFDGDGLDWISWNPTPGSAGDFRGVPNMIHTDDGGHFHPGRASVRSVIARRGPLKITVWSTSLDGLWTTQWEVFPAYARLTVLQAPADKAYWLLYEGTPGGVLESATDLVTRSDGAQTPAGETWDGDIPGEEWVYFTDPAVGRSLFVVHHQGDEIIDSYRPSTNALMTIFGFGRSLNSRYLTETPKQMTFGLVEGGTFDGVDAAVRDAYKPLSVIIDPAERRPDPPTPTPTGYDNFLGFVVGG